jgi:hypothetical protein
MALIKMYSIYDEAYEPTGRIIELISSQYGTVYKYENSPTRFQVQPGKYVVKHLCYLNTEGKPSDVMRIKQDLATIDDIELKDGDTLSIAALVSKTPIRLRDGAFVGNMPICTSSPNITNINDPKQSREYL